MVALSKSDLCSQDKSGIGSCMTAPKPRNPKTTVSVASLILSMIMLVGLSQPLSPAIETEVKAAGATKTILDI